MTEEQKWVRIGELIEGIGQSRRGPKDLYKPVVRIEYYEHDGIATVEVGRCKSMDEVVVRVTVTRQRASDAILESLLEAQVRLEVI